MRTKSKSGFKITADVSDHAKTYEPSRKRKSNAEKQRDYRLRKKKKIQESQCLTSQIDINIGTNPGNCGKIKNVPNTRQGLQRKKKSNAEKQREYRQRLKIKKMLSGVPESLQKRRRKILNNDEVKSRNAAYAKAYRYRKKIQKLSNIKSETQSQESQTFVSHKHIQGDPVTRSDSMVETIEDSLEDLQSHIKIEDVSCHYTELPNIPIQFEITEDSIHKENLNCNEILLTRQSVQQNKQVLQEHLEVDSHEAIEIQMSEFKHEIYHEFEVDSVDEFIESKPVIHTIENDVPQNNTSGDQIMNKYKDYHKYIASQMLIHQFTSPFGNAIKICDTLCGKNNLKSVKDVQNRSRQILQNSEDGVHDNGDEEAPPFEQSMETYPEYSVNNMVNVEDHKRYQHSFEDDSKSTKRHCTEIEDEYDAIGINVAAKLRNLPPNMRILAEKLINDALYQAQMNGLNSSSVITTTDPFNQVII